MNPGQKSGCETEDRTPSPSPTPSAAQPSPRNPETKRPAEIGGPPGPEPTRYGDWEKRGRCIDF
ncbi:MAG: DUF1674 domain-containing protein [Gammaproteobacteria bacterium]